MAEYRPVIYSVGTTAVKILTSKETRVSYSVVFPATTKVTGNTGLVYIGVGFPPNATAGNTQAGHIMIGGDIFGEDDASPTVAPDGKKYYKVSKGDIWAIASTTTQIIEVYEVVG